MLPWGVGFRRLSPPFLQHNVAGELGFSINLPRTLCTSQVNSCDSYLPVTFHSLPPPPHILKQEPSWRAASSAALTRAQLQILQRLLEPNAPSQLCTFSLQGVGMLIRFQNKQSLLFHHTLILKSWHSLYRDMKEREQIHWQHNLGQII